MYINISTSYLFLSAWSEVYMKKNLYIRQCVVLINLSNQFISIYLSIMGISNTYTVFYHNQYFVVVMYSFVSFVHISMSFIYFENSLSNIFSFKICVVFYYWLPKTGTCNSVYEKKEKFTFFNDVCQLKFWENCKWQLTKKGSSWNSSIRLRFVLRIGNCLS